MHQVLESLHALEVELKAVQIKLIKKKKKGPIKDFSLDSHTLSVWLLAHQVKPSNLQIRTQNRALSPAVEGKRAHW